MSRPVAAGPLREFTPKRVTELGEGDGLAALRAGVLAGLIVAIVVSALGGSRFQIGDPAGAFIVLVAATVEPQGLEGLAVAIGSLCWPESWR